MPFPCDICSHDTDAFEALRCGHVLCSKCLDRIAPPADEPEESDDEPDGYCPHCRQQIFRRTDVTRIFVPSCWEDLLLSSSSSEPTTPGVMSVTDTAIAQKFFEQHAGRIGQVIKDAPKLDSKSSTEELEDTISRADFIVVHGKMYLGPIYSPIMSDLEESVLALRSRLKYSEQLKRLQTEVISALEAKNHRERQICELTNEQVLFDRRTSAALAEKERVCSIARGFSDKYDRLKTRGQAYTARQDGIIAHLKEAVSFRDQKLARLEKELTIAKAERKVFEGKAERYKSTLGNVVTALEKYMNVAEEAELKENRKKKNGCDQCAMRRRTLPGAFPSSQESSSICTHSPEATAPAPLFDLENVLEYVEDDMYDSMDEDAPEDELSSSFDSKSASKKQSKVESASSAPLKAKGDVASSSAGSSVVEVLPKPGIVWKTPSAKNMGRGKEVVGTPSASRRLQAPFQYAPAAPGPKKRRAGEDEGPAGQENGAPKRRRLGHGEGSDARSMFSEPSVLMVRNMNTMGVKKPAELRAALPFAIRGVDNHTPTDPPNQAFQRLDQIVPGISRFSFAGSQRAQSIAASVRESQQRVASYVAGSSSTGSQ